MKKHTLTNFFALVQKELPDGSKPEYQIPVRIEGLLYFVVFFKSEDGKISFELYRYNEDFSEKILSTKLSVSIVEGDVALGQIAHIKKMDPIFALQTEEIITTVASEVSAILANKKSFVDIAQIFSSSAMDTFGKASSMLIKQFQFPFVFELDADDIQVASLDRLKELYSEDTRKCLEKYSLDGWSIEYSIREMDDEKILDFLCEIMKVERKKYTGYRILGTVGRNGHSYYCFQLFYKDPKSTTEVFSGDNAPNVQKRVAIAVSK